MHFASLRANGSKRGSPCRRLCACLCALSGTLLAGSTANAQESLPGESERALPGVVHVGVPTPSATPVVAAFGAGYGFLDEAQGLDGGHRLRSTASFAYAPVSFLALGANLRGHLDSYGDTPDADETKLYGEPRLTARLTPGGSSKVFWGVEVDARFVGAEAPSIEFGATSPSLSALLGFRLGTRTWLGAQLGYRLDGSADAVPDPSVLSNASKRVLGASSWNAVGWGVGLSHRLAAGTELLGEVSGDALVGSGSPGFAQSPFRLTAGVRHPLSRAFSLLGTVDVALSRRPNAVAPDRILPQEPRVGLGATLIWRLGVSDPKPKPPEARPPPKPEPPPPPDPKPEPPKIVTSPISGTVVDEGGRPLADVEVVLTQPDAEPKTVRTYADGGFEFSEVPEGPVQLRVSTPGFEEVTVAIDEGEERTREVMVRPAVPAGQVRGRILDLRGKPIAATITITPGDHEVEVQLDGSFELELAPGRYTVKFQHKDYTDQQRKVHVRDRGVVILNIALTR